MFSCDLFLIYFLSAFLNFFTFNFLLTFLRCFFFLLMTLLSIQYFLLKMYGVTVLVQCVFFFHPCVFFPSHLPWALLAFSSCGEWGLLSRRGVQASHCGNFSCCSPGSRACRLQQLQLAGSRAPAQQLQPTDLVALLHVKSSQTRDRTPVPCIGRQVFNHWTIREIPRLLFDYGIPSGILVGVHQNVLPLVPNLSLSSVNV